MTTTGWIFLVGMRVFDLGGMCLWLVWFFRHKDEPDEDWWDEGGGGGDDAPPSGPDQGPQGPGLDLPLPDSEPWPGRLRDHSSPPRRTVERRADPARRERVREQERDPG